MFSFSYPEVYRLELRRIRAASYILSSVKAEVELFRRASLVVEVMSILSFFSLCPPLIHLLNESIIKKATE